MKPIGVVTALPAEAATLRGAPGVRVVAGGIGAERARRAAEELAGAGVSALASWGFAGGLDPELREGAVVVPAAILDGDRLACDAGWCAMLMDAIDAVGGDLLAADRVIRTAEAKAIARSSGAIAVDLESGAIARTAREHGLPFFAVRAISDPAEVELPRAALAAVSVEGRLRPGALAVALLRRPADIAGLLRLRSGSRAALAALRAAAARLGTCLSGGTAG